MFDLNSIPVSSWSAFAHMLLLVLLVVLSWLAGGHVGTKLAKADAGKNRIQQCLWSAAWLLSFMGTTFLAEQFTPWSFLCLALFSGFLGVSLGQAFREWDGKRPLNGSEGIFFTTLVCTGLVLGSAIVETKHTAVEPAFLKERIGLIVHTMMVAISVVNGLLVLGLYYALFKPKDSSTATAPASEAPILPPPEAGV